MQSSWRPKNGPDFSPFFRIFFNWHVVNDLQRRLSVISAAAPDDRRRSMVREFAQTSIGSRFLNGMRQKRLGKSPLEEESAGKNGIWCRFGAETMPGRVRPGGRSRISAYSQVSQVLRFVGNADRRRLLDCVSMSECVPASPDFLNRKDGINRTKKRDRLQLLRSQSARAHLHRTDELRMSGPRAPCVSC